MADLYDDAKQPEREQKDPGHWPVPEDGPQGSYIPPERGMKRGAPFVLIGVAIAVVAAVLACAGVIYFIANRTEKTTEPAAVRTITDEMLTIELPPGFTPDYASTMALPWATVRAVIYRTPSDGRLMIQQTLSGRDVDPGRVEAYLQDQARKDTGGDLEIESSKPMKVTIAGEERTLTEATLVNTEDGTRYRRLTGLIGVQGGATYLALMQPESEYDAQSIEAMLASIRFPRAAA